jgi:hypothetical protein
LSSTAFNFMAVANTDGAHERTRMEPGEYRATCTAVRNPELYRKFDRWYLKVDFAIHADGTVVSKYINLGGGKEPSTNLGPRSDFYKLWAVAMGRRLEKNEPMDLSKIIGMEFMVTVGDKNHGGDGEAYSTVQSVRRYEPEALSSSLNNSPLNSSILTPQLLNISAAQVRSTAQVRSGSPDEESSGFQREFPPESIPPRGRGRSVLLESLKKADPEKAQRLMHAYLAKDAADAA